MARGDIQSRLKLDIKEFSAKLDAALKQAQQFATKAQAVTSGAASPSRAPRTNGDNEQRAATETARQATIAVRDYERQLAKGKITADDFRRTMQAFTDLLETERAQVSENSVAYGRYGTALKAVDVALERLTRRETAAAAETQQAQAKAAAARERTAAQAQQAAQAAARAAEAQARAEQRAAQASQRQDIRGVILEYRSYEQALRRGTITLEQFLAQSQRLYSALDAQRRSFGTTAQAAQAYQQAMQRIEAGRLSAELRPITGRFDELNDTLERFQLVAGAVLAGGALTGIGRGLDAQARAAFDAKVALQLYRGELRDNGRDVAAAEAALEGLARRFKTTSDVLARPATLLTRNGFSEDQISPLLERVGASALAAGRNVDEAFRTFGDAVARRDSTLLNSIGIIGNFDDWLQRAAKSQGTTVAGLDQASAAQAIYNGILAETEQEYRALDTLLSGYAGSSATLNTAQNQLGKTIGGVVGPAFAFLKDTLSLVINLFLVLPAPIKAVAVAAGVLATVIVALGAAYITLRALLFNQATLGPVIEGLLQNETILRSRLGAVLIAQAGQYNLLTRAQLANVTASRQSAVAAAAAGGSAGLLARAFGLLNKVGRFALIGIFIALIREASKYLGVFRPIVDSVSQALAGIEFSKAVQGLSQIIAGGKLFATIFGQAVLYTVTAVALALEEIGFQATRAYLLLERLAAQATMNSARVEELNVALEDNRQAHEASKNAILDNAAAYDQQLTSAYLAASGIEFVGTQAEQTAAALRDLTEVQRGTFAEISKGLGDFKLDLNAGDLRRELASATAPLDDYLAQIETLGQELGQNNPLVVGLRQSAQQLRQQVASNVLAEAVKTSQESATQATIAAMEQGSAQIEAQRRADIEAEQNALQEQLRGFKGHADTRAALIEASNARIAAINATAAAALQDDAAQKLETQRQLVSDLSDLQGQIAIAEAEASGNTVAAINARSLEQARQIEAERQAMLARVTEGDEAARAQRVQINATYDDLERQNTERLSRDLEAEHERRARTLENIAQETREIQLRSQAARQRDAGDEQGAVQTDLRIRLNAINAALEEELAAEGLTAQQITALRARANAERVAAREQAGRDTAAAAESEAQVTRDALTRSANAYRRVSASSGGSIGTSLETFRQEQEARREANAQILADFKGTSAERAQLVKQQGQLETMLTRQNGLQVNAEAKKVLTAYLVALKEHKNEVLRVESEVQQSRIQNIRSLLDIQAQAQRPNLGAINANFNTLITLQREAAQVAADYAQKQRDGRATTEELLQAQNDEAAAYTAVRDSIQGQIDTLKELRDEQVAIVNGGSNVLEYLRNFEQLSGKAADAPLSGQAKSLIKDQIDQTAALYRAAVAANAPLEERLELQGQLKSLLDQVNADLGPAPAASQLLSVEDTLKELQRVKLPPDILKLMERDVTSETATYAKNAAEAVQNAKTIDDKLADLSKQLIEATSQLVGLLGVAAGEEGLSLKVSVDKSGLEQAKQALIDAVGPEQASLIGQNAGVGFAEAFTSSLRNNKGSIVDVIKSLVQEIDEYLPHSDARRGPLSRLSHSGRAIPRTLAENMRRELAPLRSAAGMVAASARPALGMSVPTSRPAFYPSAAAAAGGGGGTVIERLYIDGGKAQPSSISELSAQRFIRDVGREADLRRKGYK